jgi:peptidoglycan/xylan/chitin deacetylase (PgdA/CDA1 family)
MNPIMWNVTAFDWKATSADYIERKVVRRVRGGNVILLHDGSHRELGRDRGYTVEATDRLIGRYKAEGYEFVTIPEMLAPSHGAMMPDSSQEPSSAIR